MDERSVGGFAEISSQVSQPSFSILNLGGVGGSGAAGESLNKDSASKFLASAIHLRTHFGLLSDKRILSAQKKLVYDTRHRSKFSKCDRALCCAIAPHITGSCVGVCVPNKLVELET